MSKRFRHDEIRKFWTDQAECHGLKPDASWSDRQVIELEIANIVRHLADGDQVLDAGCANGFSTLAYAGARELAIHGIDYIPQMIEQARTRLAGANATIARRISFDVADITVLPGPDAQFDKVIVTRVLINLGQWSKQAEGLRQCLRVLRPGGLLLLSEATVQGWTALNDFRKEWGLKPIGMPPFNTYLDEPKVIEAASASAELVEVRNFASTYYVATRVLKPLLNEALGGRVDVADPLAHFNRFVADLPPSGNYGTQKLMVFRKR